MVNCWSWYVAAICIFLRFGLCESFIPNSSWENIEYQKLVDVKHAYINEAFLITIKNIASEPQSEYFLALTEEIFEKISLFEVQLANKNVYVNASLYQSKCLLDDGSVVGYGLISLPSPIEPGKQVSLTIKLSHTAHGLPHPEHILLKDAQNLRFKTARLPFSAYYTRKANLQLLGSSKFTELSAPNDQSLRGTQRDDSYEFQSWDDIPPFETKNQLDVIYVHDLPLIEVLKLKRDVWVSHWASTLQFEEYYELINRSAKLKNGFSRLELMQDQKNMRLSHYCSVLEMNLPEESSEHYYTDLVGMVSTSRVLGDNLYIKPRYPLFGEWKYNFTVGWTNKLSTFLRQSSKESFILVVPLLNGPTDAFYGKSEISVFLPEGSVLQALDSSVPMKSAEVHTQKSYLDLNKGHIKVTCEFDNMIDANRDGQIVVKYSYPSQAAYKKPLSVACYIFAALMSFFLLKSVNLNLDKK
ncbi:hypothetical protein HG535_0A05290 [Zygotorulaspora mrakii]|uniref:Dolichyl-diphosphooligosaccharide--protein glycosyltransferase subunit 1 n=1 Tax=Zygotorulaspora mrakii TaxID=42260 RepID=A0A7H9AW18_ZYGMR|nr:uncharacterized protein HG535_0A05290 [Zygotorulaspora mrakii]QLG70588.1 hypothetical protein HG535_0A05290 [Zygotorulaspora mrakii]